MTPTRERVVVTGAAGFVGSWLCRQLVEDGHDVAGLVRRQPPDDGLFARLNLRERVSLCRIGERPLVDWLAAQAPDLVINLAGQADARSGLQCPAATFAANTASVWELLDAIRNSGVAASVVHASSLAVHGAGIGASATEEAVPCAADPYGASKAAAEIVVRSYTASFGMPAVIARLSNIYGPGDPNRARLVPSVMDALHAARRPELRGGGRSVRAYLHVDDAIDALMLLARSAGEPGVRGEAFNVAASEAFTTLQVARLAAEASGQAEVEPVIKDDKPDETSIQLCSTQKMFQRFGWRPRVELADGLAQLAGTLRETAT